MINNKGVRDTPVKPILKTPSTPSKNKVGNESKRVTVAPIQLTPQVPEQSCQTPERQQRSVVKVPIKTAVPRATQGSRDVVGTPFHGDLGPLAPRRILSNKISGENGEDVINEEIRDLPTEQVIKTWRGKTQQVYQPPPIKDIDIGISGGQELETLEPEIRTPTNEDFILPPPLESLVDKENLVHKFLPKQGDIDRLISKINKKVLRDTNLCIDLRDLKAAYLTSPHFRDIYLFLLQNKMPLGKGDIRRIESNSRNYILLDGLLFKITQDDNGNMDTVLCIPSSKVDILLNAYHSSILGGHTGITKCYHTISQRFYCPNLAESLRAYITGCHICRVTTRPPRPSSTAECLCLIARLREEQASAASWEPRPPFEVAEMD